jgi:hypothetical protein
MEDAHKQLARRRAHKAVRGIRRLGKAHPIKGHAPDSAGAGIHAEQRGTSYAVDQQVEFSDMGISKLCCAKCWMALDAAEQHDLHANLATGAHWKTYETANGWPFPAHADDAVLETMVGPVAWPIMKANRAKCARALKEKALAVKGANTTDLVSSEEEWDELDDGVQDGRGNKVSKTKAKAKAKAKATQKTTKGMEDDSGDDIDE